MPSNAQLPDLHTTVLRLIGLAQRKPPVEVTNARLGVALEDLRRLTAWSDATDEQLGVAFRAAAKSLGSDVDGKITLTLGLGTPGPVLSTRRETLHDGKKLSGSHMIARESYWLSQALFHMLATATTASSAVSWTGSDGLVLNRVQVSVNFLPNRDIYYHVQVEGVVVADGQRTVLVPVIEEFPVPGIASMEPSGGFKNWFSSPVVGTFPVERNSPELGQLVVIPVDRLLVGGEPLKVSMSGHAYFGDSAFRAPQRVWWECRGTEDTVELLVRAPDAKRFRPRFAKPRAQYRRITDRAGVDNPIREDRLVADVERVDKPTIVRDEWRTVVERPEARARLTLWWDIDDFY